ncbi:4052_t:CDS:2 [Scutellospora calospora]|uniref:4052_t:CDS:1 n=1 Tax=Scutellospora calospora TaxID=85575 RepID=A0ACA9K2N0_9GLOM|nr:4052_t:CDS:2 [Scutellospora calospora]
MEKEALDRRLRRLKKAKKTGCLKVINREQIHLEEKNQDIEIKVKNKGDDLALCQQCLRAYRKTILEKERSKKLEESKRLLELEERKKKSRLIVAEIIQKESQKTVYEKNSVNKINDIGSLDEKAGYEAWN